LNTASNTLHCKLITFFTNRNVVMVEQHLPLLLEEHEQH
jgi:hypothetical protein